MAESHTARTALTALSPLDGRYAAKTAPLAAHFSECGLVRARVRVEHYDPFVRVHSSVPFG